MSLPTKKERESLMATARKEKEIRDKEEAEKLRIENAKNLENKKRKKSKDLNILENKLIMQFYEL